MKRLSLDDEEAQVKLYDDTIKSILPHSQLIEMMYILENMLLACMTKIGTLVQ